MFGILLILFITGIIIAVFRKSYDIDYLLVFVWLILANSINWLFIISGIGDDYIPVGYKEKIYEYAGDFKNLSPKHKVIFIQKCEEYEEWRLKNTEPGDDDFLWDWYNSDAALTAPPINIDSLYNLMVGVSSEGVFESLNEHE